MPTDEDDVFTVECDGCGNEYPISKDIDAPSPEGPEHHEPDCPVRRGYIERGRWEPPDD